MQPSPTLHAWPTEGGGCRLSARFGQPEPEAFGSADAALADAVRRASACAGQVVLEPGVFLLDGPLRLPPRVRLAGSGRGSRLVLRAGGPDAAAIVLEEAHGAEVSDLSVSAAAGVDAGFGVRVRGSGEVRLSRVHASGFSTAGIAVTDHSFLCRVGECVAAGNPGSNFLFRDLGRSAFGDFIPSTLDGCLAYAGGTGFDIERAAVANVVGCTAYQTGGIGFHLHRVSNSVLVTGCRSFQVGAEAVRIDDTHEINLTGNTFCWHQREGIRVRMCRWGTITGNQIIDSGSLNSDAEDYSVKFHDLPEAPRKFHGISLEDVAGVTVSANAIFNWHVCPVGESGVHEGAGCEDNVIVGNNVNSFERAFASDEPDTPALAVANGFKRACHVWRHKTVPPDGLPIQSYRPALTQRFLDGLVPPIPPG